MTPPKIALQWHLLSTFLTRTPNNLQSYKDIHPVWLIVNSRVLLSNCCLTRPFPNPNLIPQCILQLTPVQPTLTPVQPTLTPVQPTLTPVQPTANPSATYAGWMSSLNEIDSFFLLGAKISWCNALWLLFIKWNWLWVEFEVKVQVVLYILSYPFVKAVW